MLINSQNSSFVFNLPSWFVPIEYENIIMNTISNFTNNYENAVDFFNSCIKTINFPGMNMDHIEQTQKYGLKRNYKSAAPVYNIFDREITVTFKSVLSHFNYFMMMEIIQYHYLDVDWNKGRVHFQGFQLKTIELKTGKMLFNINFNEVVFKSISGLEFNHSVGPVDEVTFTMSFVYNYIDIKSPLSDNSFFNYQLGDNILEKKF